MAPIHLIPHLLNGHGPGSSPEAAPSIARRLRRAQLVPPSGRHSGKGLEAEAQTPRCVLHPRERSTTEEDTHEDQDEHSCGCHQSGWGPLLLPVEEDAVESSRQWVVRRPLAAVRMRVLPARLLDVTRITRPRPVLSPRENHPRLEQPLRA
ncbi:Hypothetical protein AA314_07872 [Archangium gephyra]|uniref:Uncharacterized protein n=1 Tax=Archangium gephyra TaxID=48 RepID=A0AAC8QFJ8_9BACT|nr:Hypothetical protein AA314_07872 [Archangium gephyra]